MPHKVEKQDARIAQQQTPFEVTATGQTFQQISEEIKQGLPQPQNRYCYLCHRREGDPGVCLTEGEHEVNYTTITLDSYEIQEAGVFKVKYYICFECYLLLTHLEALKSESEE